MDGVFIHLVWATWDRESLLTGDMRQIAYRAIGAKCAELGATVVALGGVADHVHLLVRMPLTMSIAEFVKLVKGSSGHLLAHIALERDTFFKWQGAYGAFSVSYRDLDMITDYIKRQEEHHSQRSLMADWELPPPEDSKQGGR
jgi:REP element-mobilizing transposase RayT